MSDKMIPAGNVCHTELASNDTAATRKFLTDMFATEFVDVSTPELEYHSFGSMEHGVGGAVRPVVPEEPGPNATPYFLVEDIDVSIAKATEAGATPMVPKTPVPTMGWFAWFIAPGGVVLALWQNDPNAPPPSA
ncbi:MAG: VOC family protein [Thermoplasmatota archaeon]